MDFTNKDISRFQELYLKYFGRQLDREEARSRLSLLVRQVELVYKPITDKHFKEVMKNEVKESTQ